MAARESHPREGLRPCSGPKCPQLQVNGTRGQTQAEDQGGSTLTAKVAQFLTAVDTMIAKTGKLTQEIRDGQTNP
jgi:hypothetical protein